MIGLRSVTMSAYEKLLTVLGIVKEDSIFLTFRNLILPLVRDGEFASLHNLKKGRDSISPALLSLLVILQRLLGYSDREMARAIRVDLEVKYALGMPILNAHEAEHVIIFNYDTKPGYAGVDNPMYEPNDKVTLLLGDAEKTVREFMTALGTTV